MPIPSTNGSFTSLGFYIASQPHSMTKILQPKIAMLDAGGIKPSELDLRALDQYGSATVYPITEGEKDILERSAGCQILVVNKVPLRKSILAQLPTLKLICILATGYDNVDLDFCRERGIAVYHVKGYGSESVAQHVMAFMLTHTNRIGEHVRSVVAGEWEQRQTFSYSLHTVRELRGKTLGIIGFGQIGQRLRELAHAFGMTILVVDRGREYPAGVHALGLSDLLAASDFLSLHTPLTAETHHMIGRDQIKSMKKGAVLINTGRGALIDEDAVADALEQGLLAAAYLDVLVQEPPSQDRPSRLLHTQNCFITPHMAWHSLEARQRLFKATCSNIESFLRGDTNPNRLV